MKNNKTRRITTITVLVLIALALVLLFMSKRNNTINRVEEKTAQAEYTTIIGNTEYDITDKIETNIVPRISAGMIPIKWDEEYACWRITRNTDANWFNYNNGTPAYMMLNDGTYKSEAYYNMPSEKTLAENNIGLKLDEDELGSIYMWVPRYAYNEEEIIYIKDECVVAGSYTMPEMFAEEISGTKLALSGVWVEIKELESATETSTKVTNLNKGEEDTIYGFLKNTKAIAMTEDEKTTVQKYIEYIDNPTTNLVWGRSQTSITTINNTVLKILDYDKKEPIQVTAQNSVDGSGIVTLNIDYTLNGISKIIDQDGNECTITGNIALSVAQNNGIKQFYVIDNKGNIKIVEAMVDGREIYAKLYTDYTLAFTTTDKTISGKTVKQNYGNIIDSAYTSSSSVPWYSEASNIKTVNIVDTVYPRSTAYWFYGLSTITTINNIGNLKTQYDTSMRSMFYNCSSLTNLNLSNFNTSSVTSLYYMFYNCSSLTSLNLSSFNTSKVTSMDGMFYNCSSLTSLNLSNFNTSSVTSLYYMFYNCSSLTSLNLSSFNTSKVISMNGMFYDCSSLTSLNLSNFNTSSVTSLYYMFYNCSSLTSLNLSSFNTSKVTSMSGMFSGCTKLVSINGINNFKTGKVTSLGYMFYNCSSLKELDLGSWDTSNVTNMSNTFGGSDKTGCSSLEKLILTNWNTSKVTTMRVMFYYCQKLTSLDVSSFDTTNVTDMGWMFYYCSNLTSIDTSKFVTDKVTNMKSMFAYCKKLQLLDLTSFDTSKVENMDYMFYYCSNLTKINVSSKWSDSQATKTSMYSSCGTSYVTIPIYAKYYASTTTLAFFSTPNGNLSGQTATNTYGDIFDKTYTSGTSSSTASPWYSYRTSITKVVFADRIFPRSTAYWFYGFTKLSTIELLTNLNTTYTTNMKYMFYNCSALTSLDIRTWDTSNVTDISYMFYGCSNLTEIKIGSKWKSASSVSTTTNWNGANKITGGAVTQTPIYVKLYTDGTLGFSTTEVDLPDKTLSKSYGDICESSYSATSQVPWYNDRTSIQTVDFTGKMYPKSMAYWFYGCTNLKTIIIPVTLDTSKVTTMYGMFYECSNLTSLDLSNFSTSVVTTMQYMFYGCNSLRSITFGSDFKTTKVQIMSNMFQGCSSLTSLDLSNFNTSVATTMRNMFYGCSKLTSLNLTSFNTSKVTAMYNMFYNCNSLTNITFGSNFTTSAVTAMYNMFYNCSSLTSIDLSNFNTTNVTDMSGMFYGCSKLTSLNLTSFNTSKVTTMEQMFFECSNLGEIRVSSNWKTAATTTNMFAGCKAQSVTVV